MHPPHTWIKERKRSAAASRESSEDRLFSPNFLSRHRLFNPIVRLKRNSLTAAICSNRDNFQN